MKLSHYLALSVMGIGFVCGLSQGQAPSPGRAPALTGAARAGRAGAAAAGAGKARAGRANVPPEQRIDHRQANQQKRISAGIAKGQLTPDEVTKLQGMETNIDTLESSFKSDGKLSKDEVKQLRSALNDASLQIWAERHDTEGNQKSVSRLGKDVFAQDGLTARLESPDLTKAEARAFLQDFRKMVNLKRRLASDTLSPEQRAKLQGEYDDLLNRYFVVK
jgi:hypothetical protein